MLYVIYTYLLNSCGYWTLKKYYYYYYYYYYYCYMLNQSIRVAKLCFYSFLFLLKIPHEC